MTKSIKAKLIRLGSAKRLTKGGDQAGPEPLVFKSLIG